MHTHVKMLHNFTVVTLRIFHIMITVEPPNANTIKVIQLNIWPTFSGKKNALDTGQKLEAQTVIVCDLTTDHSVPQEFAQQTIL